MNLKEKNRLSVQNALQMIFKEIRSNIHNLIVLILIVVVLLQRCDIATSRHNDTIKIVKDTVWVHNDTMVVTKPQIIKTIPIDVSRDTIINHYIPDTNYQKLVLQYQEVVNQLLAKNIHEDMIRIDTNGYVKITDTVQRNTVIGRSSEVSIKYPIIKETITLPAPKVRQVYAGGQVAGNSAELINSINAGLLLKNKKDQIYGITVGLSAQGQVSYGLQSYWKLKLK
jgi:hypothetical protein